MEYSKQKELEYYLNKGWLKLNIDRETGVTSLNINFEGDLEEHLFTQFKGAQASKRRQAFLNNLQKFCEEI